MSAKSDKPSQESDKIVTAGEFPRSSTCITIDDSASVRAFFQADESYRRQPAIRDCYKCSKLPAALIKKIVIIFTCTVIAVSFTVPIIIYGVDADRRSYGEENSTMLINPSLDNCIETTDVDVQESNDNISMLSLYNNQCVEYNGVCTEYLTQLNNETLFTFMLHGISEDTIIQFMDYIALASEQCHNSVLPLFCQYIFPPCNISSSTANFISQTHCINVRDAVCSFEWRVVMNTPSAYLLPNCENFSDNDDDNNITLLIAPQSLQCHYQFKEFCGLCLPLCGEFSQYRDEIVFKEKTVTIFSAAAAFIGGILVFIVSAYRWRVMLDFPSVHVVYNTICAFVIACFVLITYIGGQERLYCSHEVLNVAYDNPTAFCQVAGFVFHWGLVLLAAFWLLHLIHLFIKIAFPLWSRRLDVKQTKIILHATEAIGALILCGMAPVAFISTSEYSIAQFPPLLCLPSKEVNFYTVCIPLCVIVGTGVILTTVMFWILHERRQLFEKRDSKFLRYCISFSVPELKTLIFSCFFIIFGITALITLSISIRDSDIAIDKLFDYFACQASGNIANNTCYEEYHELEKVLNPDLNIATYFLMGMIPWLNLLFAIKVGDVKRRIQRFVHRYSGAQHSSYTIPNISVAASDECSIYSVH